MVKGLKISTGPGKKAVWVDCGIHAREWISPPVCMKLIEDVIANPEKQNLVDWYILPVTNPDGYAFTWSEVSHLLLHF
jgi:murein tripeptide amidase MpaA